MEDPLGPREQGQGRVLRRSHDREHDAALYLGENAQDPDLDKVRKALQEVKANSKLFWASANDWTKPYSTQTITMGNLWSGLAGTLKADGKPLEYIFPKGGTVRWGDNWAIVKNAPNADLA